jgi:hypothetical protein
MTERSQRSQVIHEKGVTSRLRKYLTARSSSRSLPAAQRRAVPGCAGPSPYRIRPRSRDRRLPKTQEVVPRVTNPPFRRSAGGAARRAASGPRRRAIGGHQHDPRLEAVGGADELSRPVAREITVLVVDRPEAGSVDQKSNLQTIAVYAILENPSDWFMQYWTAPVI